MLSKHVFRSAWIPLVIAAFLIMNLLSMSLKSPSGDEISRLISGYCAWSFREPVLTPFHLPLTKLLVSLAARLQEPMSPSRGEACQKRERATLTHDLLYRPEANRDRIIFWGRFPMTLLGAGLLVMIYVLAKKLWHPGGAAITLLCAACCPTLTALSQLMSDDLPLTLGFVWVSLGLWIYRAHSGLKEILFLAFGFAFGLAAKTSGILLIPYLGLFALVSRKKFVALPNLRVFLLHLLILIVIPVFVLSFTYGYLFNLWPYLSAVYEVFVPAAGRNFLTRPSGYAYFMNGRFSPEGFFLYYPFALLVKIPLPIQILCLLGSVAVWRRKAWREFFHLASPFAIMLLAGMMTRVNIGVRLILPCFPFLFLLAGAIDLKPRAMKRYVAPLLLVWLISENVRIFPDYLSYFNQWVGGARHGLRYLDDSNIDWGLDLQRLPARLEALGIQTVKLDYDWAPIPTEIPRQSLMELDMFFPEGDFVIAAHNLRRDTLVPGCPGYGYDWLERYQPADIIGHSLYIYRFAISENPGFAAGINLVDQKSWIEHGLTRLDSMRERHPACWRFPRLAGDAHLQYGSPERALAIYLGMGQKFAKDERFLMNLAAAHFKVGQYRQSAEALRRVLSLNPDNLAAPSRLKEVNAHLRRPRKGTR